MSVEKRRISRPFSSSSTAIFLVMLMLCSTITTASDTSFSESLLPEPQLEITGEKIFHPGPNQTNINSTLPTLIQVPTNKTFLDGTIEVEPIWNTSSSNGTHFGIDTSNQWNGTHISSNGIGHGGRLTLATNSSLGTITDFESTVTSAPRWLGSGQDHEVWSIQRPSIVPVNTNSGMLVPDNGSNSVGFLSTQAFGDIGPNMEGCLQSPVVDTPFLINNYTLTFEHWTALLADDAAWIDIRHTNGSWGLLSPSSGYPSSASLNNTPPSVWNGEYSNWSTAYFQLDSLVTQFQSTVQFRLCFHTSSTPGLRGGWFVDNFEIRNEGDPHGAWFHGNMTGDYLPNAFGELILPVNLSNMTGQNVELELWVNWDIQGGASDYLVTEISLDNGHSFFPISIYPGHPNRGAVCNGQWFNGADSQNQWCPIYYSLPWTTTAPLNASTIFLRIVVETDAQVNYGGMASSGWEGIAIDDIAVWTDRGTASQVYKRVKNFTQQPSGINGSVDGWLVSTSGANEWQWQTSFGHNTASTTSYNFDSGNQLPAGWSLWSQSSRSWDIGSTSNSSGFGPGVWHSGANGAGIYLNDEYRNNMWTELYTPEYFIPENSTSRLTFRSWVCTEANWDGGAVSISTDGGENWWFIPPTLGSFHDQISTTNVNSPLFNQGIFDGSRVVGGCHNVQRGFDLKQYDLSNLTGQSVRAKFTFFSDQLIELDGWYIDDAGIEIDVYEPEGSWISESLVPDPSFGWGQLDGFVQEPENTTVRFDILDDNDMPIPGFQNRTLPIDLPLDVDRYPSIKVKVRMSSLERLITPNIEKLSIGASTYLNAYHLKYPHSFTSTNLNLLNVNSDFALQSQSASSYTSISWPTIPFCPFNIAEFQLIGGNLTASHNQYTVIATRWDQSINPTLAQTIERQGRPQMSTDFSLTWAPGQSLQGFMFEPMCSTAPKAAEVKIGVSPTTLFSWPQSSASNDFGFNQHFYGFDLANSSFQSGLHNLTFVHNTGYSIANLSILMARNRAIGSGNSGYDVSFLIEATTDGNGASFRPLSSSQTTNFEATTSPQFHRIHSSGTCSTQVQLTQHLDICTIQVQLNGNFSAKLSELQFVPYQQLLSSSLSHQLLNSILDNATDSLVADTVQLPLTILTETGSVMVNLSYSMQTKMVDHILEPNYDRWLPKQTVSFETQHWRGDAHSLEFDAPDISSVKFMLSSNPSELGRFVEVEAFDLDSNPSFRQLSGAGLASLNVAQSAVQCTKNTCSVNWSFTSRWLMDDIDDVYILAKATDVEGFSTGPAVFYRQTLFNEIENDLEIIDFNVIDMSNRNLADWSNPQWPFHLKANQSLMATGQVRFEGIVGAFADQGDAEVRIDATASPPINESGGPNEWPSVAVNWSTSWYGSLDSNGFFSIALHTPSMNDDLPSNTRIVLSPHLHRLGPLSEDSTTSIDRTSPSQNVPYLFDKIEPNTAKVEVLDSGQYVAADGHIWTSQQDVALRLTLQDPEGLSDSVEFYSWLESNDDSNQNGIMEEEEYRVQTVTFNVGLNLVEIDLPLLPWQQIRSPQLSSGKASIVIKGFDMAGNTLLGGGDFGEELDLATFEVQERMDTSINAETLSFDLFQSHLLPGFQHTFSFDVTDGNGIDSFDAIELALLTRDESEQCALNYKPRFNQLSYDNQCFGDKPLITIEKKPLFSQWNVKIQFRLSWDLFGSTLEGTPSLKIFDEGQDLGLGFSRMLAFDWALKSELELGDVNITDQTLPVGTVNDTNIWVHEDDTLSVHTTVYHRNTSIVAEHLPESVYLQALISDGERSRHLNTTFSSLGQIDFSLQLNSTILQFQQASLQLKVVGLANFTDLKTYAIVFDYDSPRLSLPPGILSQLNSNDLEEIEVALLLRDEVGVKHSSVMMHWQFTRAGNVVEGSMGSAPVQFLSRTSSTSTFSSYVNMKPLDESVLVKNDQLSVWFSGEDLSGRSLNGIGTEDEPFTPNFQWVAFEPQFENILVTPYRPSVGEEVEIFVRVSNVGLLGGNMTVECYDDMGRVITQNSSFIESGSWVDFVWDIEAWQTGRLGLTVRIVNHTGNVPVPVADVQEFEQKSSQSTTALGFAGLVVLLSGGILIAAILRRRERMNLFTVDQVEKALARSGHPPPRPKDLVELTQEE